MTPQEKTIPYTAPANTDRKVCSRCREPRPLYDFKSRPKNTDGLNGICRSCENKEKRDKNFTRVSEEELITCTKCFVEKNGADFSTYRSKTNGICSWCKGCHAAYGKANPKKESIEDAKDRRERRRKWVSAQWIYATLHRCKRRAKQKGIPFNIESRDLLSSDGSLPEYCVVFPHIKMDYHAGPDRRLWASVDKIVPELGYTKGNVCVISFAANIWKNNGSNEAERKRIIEIMTGNKTRVRHYDENTKEQGLLFTL
jgi:hypothetical protein